MSRISRDIYTSLDVNGPYIRIDTQPTSTITEHNKNGTFTLAASTYYLTGDEAEIGNIDVLEADAVAPTDTTLGITTANLPHTAKDQGYISYQWYEISVDPTDQSETVNKLTDGTLYSGTTTNTLTVKNTLSPSYHLNRYYCDLDYIPTTVNGKFDTGNAVNDILKSDEVTLNVRPFLIINTEPVSVTTQINKNDGSVFTKASLSDTRFPWDDYRLQFQWWEKDKLNEGTVPNIGLIDGDFTDTFTRYRVEELVVNRIQKATKDFSVTGSDTNNTIVGIPTEAVEVSVKIFGANGGKGGDEDDVSVGGSGGSGRVGEFKFSSTEINNINNAGSPTDYLLVAGSGGNGGRMGDGTRSGGLGGFSYAEPSIDNSHNSVSGGSGGDSGPGGESGSGGGGGAGSGIIRYTNVNGKNNGDWLALAGGGGGGGGASEGASGGSGDNAGEWEEYDVSSDLSDTKQVTVVNYNPIAGTEEASFDQDRVDYGFYVKTSTETTALNTTTSYDRIVVVWNNRVIVNLSDTKLSSNSLGLYVQSGSVKYYASTHKGSLLGWCDDDRQDEICIRGNGGYVNSFDVYKQGEDDLLNLCGFDGGTGEDKIIGDGGGGGGGGGGAHSPTSGGNVGSDPIPSSGKINLTFRVFNKVSDSLLNGKYIKFIENSWYGFPETEPERGDVVTVNKDNLGASTFTVKLKPNTTYDVVSNFEAGRTSDSLRLLQDLTATGNENEDDIIFGRSIGMNADGDDGTTEESFRDFIITVSDGTFDYSPQTVKLETEEIVGRAIIKFTTPASVTNSVKSTGGEGGRSEYRPEALNLIPSGNYGLNGSPYGRVDLTYKTEQPYNTLEETIKSTPVTAKYSVRGSSALEPSGYTSTLTIKSNYVFSKRVLCQITAWNISTNSVALTSGPDTVYTNTADITFSDDRDNSIVVEQIRYNDDFAILSNVNLNNGDLTFERSTLEGQKEVAYYSFYSNEDIEVDVKMYGGKGNDFGANVGGEGGFSYLRLNMEADTEYVITGLDNFVNTPFLFKRSRLLACVGGGGDANTQGDGAPGGGVTINGGNALPRGGIGGNAPTTLDENGALGSASIGMALPFAVSGDIQEPIPNGGTTVRCSKGNPIPGGPSPCTNRSGNTKFKTSNLADVVNTKEISRGFKAGYNVLYTAGRNNGAVINRGWGGSGATGGGGSDEYGGGGGSGYIIPDLTTDIFARSEEQSNQDGTDPITSTLGGSTGPAKVVISLAEVPSSALPGFIERPAEPNVSTVDVDAVRVPDFEPLPELVAPPLVNPPVPSMSITSMESTGFASGTKTFTPLYTGTISVLEKGQLDVKVKTQFIPPGVTYYWKILKLSSNALYTNKDFFNTDVGTPFNDGDDDEIVGSFTTSKVGEEVVGSFTIKPYEDNETDFIGGVQKWTFDIYTDRAYKHLISNSATFELLDTSLSAPVATFSGLHPDQGKAERILNSIDEASSKTINVSTQNIKNDETIYWKLLTSSGKEITATTTPSTSDFVGSTVSGTAKVTSGYKLDVDGVPVNISSKLSTANLGTASFKIDAFDDVITEGTETFGLQIEYPSDTVITRTVGTIVGEVKKSIKIIDTSIDPEVSFTGDSSVNEGNTLTVTVNTVYLKEDDAVYWKLFKSDGSTEADAADFVGGVTTGNFSIRKTSGTAPAHTFSEDIEIKPRNDSTTEGTESFRLKVYRNAALTDALHSIGTIDEAFFDFDVIDTSLSDIIYESVLPVDEDGKNTIPEDGQSKDITFKVKNLFRETVLDTERGPTYYWRIYEHESGGVHALGTPVIKNVRGDIIEDEFIKDFTDYEGNFKVKYSGDETGSVPVHEITFSIIPEIDFLDDGDKDYVIRFFDSKTEFDEPGLDGSDVHTSLPFTVKDTSKHKYEFNTAHGYGVSTDPMVDFVAFNKPSPDDAPAVDEGKHHSFRLETTAQPGTYLEYEFQNVFTNNKPTSKDDFEDVDDDILPRSGDTRLRYNIYDNSYPDSREGYLYTLPYSDDDARKSSDTMTNYGRSVAFIYVNPTADKSPRPGQANNEGNEEFRLIVKDEFGTEVAKIDPITLRDSSILDEEPEITMSLTSSVREVRETITELTDFATETEKFYQVDADTANLRIDWKLNGGDATAGSYEGTGFDSNPYETPPYTAPEPKVHDPKRGRYWYISKTSNSTTEFSVPSNDDPTRPILLKFKMKISNDDGNQESEFTLNLSIVKKATTWTTRPLFRYYRINRRHQGDPGSQTLYFVNRHCVTGYGPDGETLRKLNRGEFSQSQKETWGQNLRGEIEANNVATEGAGPKKGEFQNYFPINPQVAVPYETCHTDWVLEGVVAFAFFDNNYPPSPEQPPPPEGTYSIRQLYNQSSSQFLRDYFDYPGTNADYYIWHTDSAPQVAIDAGAVQQSRNLAVANMIKGSKDKVRYRLSEIGAEMGSGDPYQNAETSGLGWTNPAGFDNVWSAANEGTFSWRV